METPSPALRKLTLAQRRQWLTDSVSFDAQEAESFRADTWGHELADLLVENSVGWFRLPLGIVSGLVVNGVSHEVPLVTEEPSVIAAASYAARLLGKAGGLQATAAPPVMRAQVFLEGTAPGAEARLLEHGASLEAKARDLLGSMERRGGGLRGLSVKLLPEVGCLAVNIDVDVRDALGANLLNSLAESLTPALETAFGGHKILAILSNDASERIASARFQVPVGNLAKPGFPGLEMARRLVLAAEIAQHDPQRAVTHNKGIMNGIAALALATGNDTRALEASVHSWASHTGTYRGLSTYCVEDGLLRGTLTLPLALATVGGSTQALPLARVAVKLLEVTSSQGLCEIAVALGLAQNFAALFALAGEGLQRGHMALHARRVVSGLPLG